MPWVVGIDEAGYGPNLGPLLQAAVAVKMPASDVAGWDTLKPYIRRHADRDKKRTLVDDSKRVHSGKNGLEKLEQGYAFDRGQCGVGCRGLMCPTRPHRTPAT